MAKTVAQHLADFNRACDDYLKQVEGDTGVFIRKQAIVLVKEVVLKAGVETGRYRAAWLPFLWRMGIQVELRGNDAAAQAEGIRLGRYKYKFKGPQVFAWIQNRVFYATYLEYGTKYFKGYQGIVRSVIKRHHDHVRRQIKRGAA